MDESNISDQHQSCLTILDLIHNAGLIFTVTKRLAEELTGGTVPTWPVDGQLLVASLTIKYAILHYIGSHIPDVSTDFDSAFRGSRGLLVASPGVGHHAVVPIVLANRLLQALIVGVGQIAESYSCFAF
ncbi:flocculation protein FLO11-like [Cucumis melo var. makuwa]|uniref:Flocculation protein FLO11-like n=1 Tax=Cucumis melo var. makuwa TaxID=1194695 RepID=A0A5D3CXX6_CUCMM|nr:flocculation protein FLO11-like [Cucumis melo var. makuwa]